MDPVALTDSLALRPLATEDFDELFALIEREQAHLAPWMPWAEVPDRRRTAQYLEAAQAQAQRGDGVQLVITQDGAIVGSIGFHAVDWRNLSTSIGYWIASGVQGRGVMTSAVEAVLDHAFGAWQMHRVEIRAAVANARSRAIPERLGFTLEGVHRQAERFADHYKDQAVYALLAPEWQAQRAEASG